MPQEKKLTVTEIFAARQKKREAKLKHSSDTINSVTIEDGTYMKTDADRKAWRSAQDFEEKTRKRGLRSSEVTSAVGIYKRYWNRKK